MGTELSVVDIERARAYIASVRWKDTVTMKAFAPHEYTVRKWNPTLESEFEWFVMWIREHGYKARWGKHEHIYLELDGQKYWTMGAPLSETVVINREVVRSDNGDK